MLLYLHQWCAPIMGVGGGVCSDPLPYGGGVLGGCGSQSGFMAGMDSTECCVELSAHQGPGRRPDAGHGPPGLNICMGYRGLM